jgi:hypothetical protein
MRWGTVAKKRIEDDEVFNNAKKKINDAINACEAKDVSSLVSLVNTLTKMKMVELKLSDDEWGAGLGDDPK